VGREPALDFGAWRPALTVLVWRDAGSLPGFYGSEGGGGVAKFIACKCWGMK